MSQRLNILLNKKPCYDIYITNNFDELVKFFLNGSNPLTDGIKKQIVKNSDLNAGYIEQAIFVVEKHQFLYGQS